MRRGRRRGFTAAVAIAAVALSAVPASAGAYGNLDLRWTATTTNWNSYPGRDGQSTYDPCEGLEFLGGIGAWVIESAPTVPTYSEFRIGKAYVVSDFWTDQYAGGPNPDSNREVTDNLFKNANKSLSMGESTVCTEGVDPTYVTAAADSPGKQRTSVIADCGGEGYHVMSGGGKAPGPIRSQRLVESAPWDSADQGSERDDGWRVEVDNLRAKEREVEAFAICGQVPDFSYESVQFEAGKRKREHVELPCPAGEYSLGGGLTHDVPFGKAAIVASRHGEGPTPASWITELDNLTRERADGRTFVICHT